MVNSKQNLGAVAIVKTNHLQSLIDKLNNTTVGDISNRIDSNDTDISILSDRIDSNDRDISSLSDRIDSNDTSIALINEKINTLASLFSLVFNDDGTLDSEDYTTHTHDYIDSTISDTTDGTGEQTDTTKTTTGVQ